MYFMFLINSRANKSVLPTSAIQLPIFNIVLTATNIRIRTYGRKSLYLDMGLTRLFIWTFEVADVSRSIFGADFLHYHSLLVDVRRNHMIDSHSDLVSKIVIATFWLIRTLTQNFFCFKVSKLKYFLQDNVFFRAHFLGLPLLQIYLQTGLQT